MDYDLTVENIYDLKRLVLITNQISDTYNDLVVLEIAHLKNSIEYTRTLARLHDLIFAEQVFYTKYSDNSKVISEIYKYVSKNTAYSFFEVLTNVSTCTEKYLINSRILEKLKDMMDVFANQDDMNAEDYLFVEEVEEDKYADEDVIDADIMLDEQIRMDYLRTVLNLLRKYIKDNKYQKIKDYLLVFKYRLAFVFKDLEKELMDNNFNISEELYWGYPAIASFENLKIGELKEAKDYCSEEILFACLTNFLELYKKDAIDDESFFEGIINQILSRSAVLFASDKIISSYQDTIISELKRLPKNTQVKNMLNGVMQYKEEDTALIKLIFYDDNLTR